MSRKIDLDIQKVIKLFEEGVKVEEIAEQMGCGRTTIRDRLRMAGIDTSRSRTKNGLSEAEHIIMNNLNPLEQFEIEEYEQKPEEVKQRFKIDNLEQANWALRKIKAYSKQQAELDDLAEKEIQRIREWQEKEKKKTQRSIDFFESILTLYLYEQRIKDPKFKVSTPYGTISTRKQQPKWEIKDKEGLVTWLKENNLEQLVRIKEEPALKDIKGSFEKHGVNAIDENGEIIPGIYILEQPDKVIIKITE